MFWGLFSLNTSITLLHSVLQISLLQLPLFFLLLVVPPDVVVLQFLDIMLHFPLYSFFSLLLYFPGQIQKPRYSRGTRDSKFGIFHLEVYLNLQKIKRKEVWGLFPLMEMTVADSKSIQFIDQ